MKCSLEDIYFFVEGPDDSDFVKYMIMKLYSVNIEDRVIEYACQKKDKTKNYLKTLVSMKKIVFFLHDNDGRNIEKQVKDISNLYDIHEDRVFIAVFEIESWYYAGLTESNRKKYKIKNFSGPTEKITKEKFNSLLNDTSNRKITMIDILSSFDYDLAKKNNHSFEFFYNSLISTAV